MGRPEKLILEIFNRVLKSLFVNHTTIDPQLWEFCCVSLLTKEFKEEQLELELKSLEDLQDIYNNTENWLNWNVDFKQRIKNKFDSIETIILETLSNNNELLRSFLEKNNANFGTEKNIDEFIIKQENSTEDRNNIPLDEKQDIEFKVDSENKNEEVIILTEKCQNDEVSAENVVEKNQDQNNVPSDKNHDINFRVDSENMDEEIIILTEKCHEVQNSGEEKNHQNNVPLYEKQDIDFRLDSENMNEEMIILTEKYHEVQNSGEEKNHQNNVPLDEKQDIDFRVDSENKNEEIIILTEKCHEVQNATENNPDQNNVPLDEKRDIDFRVDSENMNEEIIILTEKYQNDVQNSAEVNNNEKQNIVTGLPDENQIAITKSYKRKRKMLHHEEENKKIKLVPKIVGFLVIKYDNQFIKGVIAFTLASFSHVVKDVPCKDDWIKKLAFYVQEMKINYLYMRGYRQAKFLKSFLPEVNIYFLKEKKDFIKCKVCKKMSCSLGKIRYYFKTYYNYDYVETCF